MAEIAAALGGQRQVDRSTPHTDGSKSKIGYNIQMALPQLQNAVEPRTLTGQVAAVIRDSILQGKLKGGQVLRQEDLAEQLNVSRIPVREALRQLDAEGFVALNPHRGAVVVSLTANEVEEIYDIRVALETQAMRLAIPHFTPEILREAQAVLDHIDNERKTVERKATTQSGKHATVPLAKWGDMNWRFHEVLYRPANRPRLLSMIKSLHDNVGRYLRAYVALDKHAALSQQQHRKLLTACKEGNADRAADILEQHLQAASRRLREQLSAEAEIV